VDRNGILGMNDINGIECSRAVFVPYKPGAADECEIVLRFLGFEHIKVHGSKGSHSAELYVPEEDRLAFDGMCLNHTVHGKYRNFFFSIGTHFGVQYHYVSYSKKK
jgi:hypothetical protein